MKNGLRKIGFPIPLKENERRRALTPEQLPQLERLDLFHFEHDYFSGFGMRDEHILELGASVLPRQEVLQLDVVCNPKGAETQDFEYFPGETLLFGWIHAVQGRSITDFLLKKNMTAIAWEDMYEHGRHVFWRNNQLAGEAAVMHACTLAGRAPEGVVAAVLGRGHTAQGAIRVLSALGAEVHVFVEREIPNFKATLGQYDAVVNCVMWDVSRRDRILCREDLRLMKRGSMIIDVSCNDAMEIETSRPTSIESPTFTEEGILHYCVDHTPSLLYWEATRAIGNAVLPFLNILSLGQEDASAVLRDATIIERGQIRDKRISRFQCR